MESSGTQDLYKHFIVFLSLSKKGTVVVFSIHQPRYAVFKLFDTLTLLAKGHTVFHGPATEALDFFKQQGNDSSI